MITPRLGYRPQKWCVFMVDEIQLSPKRRFKLKESARDRHNPKSQLQAPIYQPHMIHQHLWYERRDLNTASIAGTKTHSLLKCTVCSDWLTSSDQAVLCRSSSDVTHHNQNWTVLPVLILKVWKKKNSLWGITMMFLSFQTPCAHLDLDQDTNPQQASMYSWELSSISLLYRRKVTLGRVCVCACVCWTLARSWSLGQDLVAFYPLKGLGGGLPISTEMLV